MPTAFIYVRVSTDKQDLSPEWQEEVCRNYYTHELAARGFDLHPEAFRDIAQSARSIEFAERNAGRELFKLLKRGDIIVAAKQDRVWRNNRDRENCLFFFKQTGIELALLDMGIDTSTAAGRFASGIVGLQAQWESDVRSERAKAAHQVRKKRRTPGRRYPPPGWKWDARTSELVPDMNERKLLEVIFKWRALRVRNIQASCTWLTEEGIRRDCGTKYSKEWVTRAHYSLVKQWPQEGYIQAFWKGKRDDSVLAKHYRLPQFGKAKVRIAARPIRNANEADLRWISSAFQVALSTSEKPDESIAAPLSPVS